MKYRYIAASIVCAMTFSSCGDSDQDSKSKATPIENETSQHEKASPEIDQIPKEQLVMVMIALAGKDEAEALSKLLKAGANPDCNLEGMTPLLAACAEGNVSCVKILLEHGANVNARGDNVATPLMMAIFAGKPECVKVLIQAGARVHARANGGKFKGMTPLMVACTGSNVSCVKILLEHGADVNERAGNGVTALMMASFAGKPECVKVLIQAGANVHARADEGETALEFAVLRGELECAKLLRAAGATD